MAKVNTVKVIETQKICANAILRMLSMVDPNSCILGGAPRDWQLGSAAKDLDVYVQGYPDESSLSVASRVAQALELQPGELEDITSSSYYVQGLDNGVLSVFNVKNCAVPIQVVVCDRKPITMLDTFHGSLSKAFYVRGSTWSYLDNTDDFDLGGTLEFEISKKFKVHLISKTDSAKYIAKVQAKYPNFTAVYE